MIYALRRVPFGDTRNIKSKQIIFFQILRIRAASHGMLTTWVKVTVLVSEVVKD